MMLPQSVLQAPATLGDLLDVKSFSEVCQSFAELYRVGVKVFDIDGHKLVDVKVGNADFCGYIWQQQEGRSACMATVQQVKGAPVGEEAKPTTFDCFSGCRYVVQPVVYEGDALGRIVFGPFVPEDLTQLPTTLTNISSGFDAAAATAYLAKIRRVPQATAEKILHHFGEILEVLVFSGHKNLLTARLHIEAVQESYRELQEKNRQVELSYGKLKELDRLKSNFIATMSHELRTPLTSVIGYSEMMLEGLGGALTSEQREYVGIIMEKGENLLQLITSILDITKIEAGRVRLVLSDVELEPLVRDALSTVAPQARKKNLTVTFGDVVGTLPKVHCDREKVRQCLINLLANAVKFTPAGGTITVGGKDLGDERVALYVTDTGIGIAAENLPRVWDVFYQVDGSSTREYGGAGLGLAIVKSFVEAHGGEVQVASSPEQGSTFTLVFPRRATGAAAARSHPTARSAAG
ncbi:MAG TPA: ATP-binding protein [Anaeromyxobacteraceae bacterium]|nr:ATP-binding protein [Anaeromyxobacteraceae bacterium]